VSKLPDIEALLQRVTAREAKALQELHQAVSHSLLGVILSILKNQHEAEETLQDVFLRIWKNSASYRSDRGSAMSWLITVARNASLDRYRKRVRQVSEQERAESDLQENYTMPPATATDLILTAERREGIKVAMTSLPDEQREAIELAFFAGHTQTEVAERLGVPLGTIKARIRRGMQSLKPKLLTESA